MFYRYFYIILLVAMTPKIGMAKANDIALRLGSSWSLPSEINKNWKFSNVNKEAPQGLVIIENKTLFTSKITFVVLTLDRTSTNPAQYLCSERRKIDKLTSPKNKNYYSIIKIQDQNVCGITSTNPDSFSKQLLLPGRNDFVQTTIYNGQSPDLAKKYIKDLVSKLRYLQ